ncbi:MAG TPA: hypothetical protein QGH10_16780, partial [Armatimonadota bacterium]|nr:hypothetical protein [Armatimonadota bacterium]
GDAAADLPIEHQRPIVLTRLTLGADAADDPVISNAPEDVPRGILGNVLGHIDPTRGYHSYESDTERNMVCWPTRDFGVAAGCSHGCFYCGDGKFGKHVALGMNIDEFMEQVVEPTILETPDQRCFRMMGWGADAISLEPEYGVFRSYLATLAKHDRYGYFHSNSDNVDWIADEPKRDRLIGVWSLASEGIASQIEPGSPSAAARIEAMRKCSEMGIPIRIKLKPTIPIIGWREDYAALIESVFASVRPETIGFCVMIWMTLETVNARFPGLIDPDFIRAAEESIADMDGETHSPFPHDSRAEIYRFLTSEVRKHDADVPIFLSTETREMWEELADEIGQNARTFMCGCNPVQLPGPRMKTGETIPASTYFPSS